MGITGLIPFLKKSSRLTHVREFKGCTVAIDTYCWLHKGAFACADKLAKNEKTDMHIKYCMKFINLLLSHEIKPILVFDGQNLPSKAGTETKRRESRDKYRKQAREFLRQGNNAKARECFQRCVDITSQMALDLMQAARSKSVDCIVAPYEADAQLAYLCKQGIAHVIITEDSDLLAFGCERVLLKMDASGNGLLIEKEKLHLSLGPMAHNFSYDKFRQMCILSGCDYLPSLPGIGLGKAFKFFSRITEPDIRTALSRLPFYLNMSQLEVTQEYKDAFVQADLTFLYQLVFDPVQRKMVPLNPYPAGIFPEDIPFAGKYLDPDMALQFSLGNLDSHSLTKIADFHPDRKVNGGFVQNPQHSIWSPHFVPRKFESSQTETETTERAIEFSISKRVEVTVNVDVNSKSLNCSTEVVEEVLTTEQLSAQYSAAGSTSPVLSCKRRRISASLESIDSSSVKENLLFVTSQYPEGPISVSHLSEGPISDAVQDAKQPIGANSPPANQKTPNPFAKGTSPGIGRFTRLCSTSELQRTNHDGTDLVISSYFQTTPTTHKTTPNDPTSSPIKSRPQEIVLETPEKCQEAKTTENPEKSKSLTLVKLRERFQFNQGKDMYQLDCSTSSMADYKPVKPYSSTLVTPVRTSSFGSSSVLRRKPTSKIPLPPATATSMRQMKLQDMFGCKRHSST